MKLVKLDKRHAGSSEWKYLIEMPYILRDMGARRSKFNDIREWCWTTWGPSKELTDYDHTDLFDGVHCSNQYWCWVNDANGKRRIYLRTDKEAELFTLKWL